MSNFELNKRLAELAFDEHWWWKGGTVFVDKDTKDENGELYVEKIEFNPCTNWNDIMPIAVELGVSLIPSEKNMAHFAYANLEIEVDGYSSDKCEYDDSPQIALVKCCIAILESRL